MVYLLYPTVWAANNQIIRLRHYLKQFYIKYNPKANELLDKMGLKWDKNYKWRVRPDGKTLTVVIEDIDVGAVRGYGKIRPLLKEYWEKIGVKTILKTIDPGLFGTRLWGNQLQITL